MSDSEPPSPPAVDVSGPTLPPMTLPSRDGAGGDLTGTLLAGRFRLERLLGQGGMGAVYKADHLALGVKVAVKVMHGAYGVSPEAERRFAREAHATSLLAHRNIVRVLDYGKSEALHFIEMELHEGESLAAWLERQKSPPPLAEVADLVRQIADALGAAHAGGVVHRDLKPDNVFLAYESGGSQVAKVVDFGLAHVEEDSPEGTLTRADAVAGTPYYMSPEQCRSLKVGAATDLYALGCILTELLQLAPPFEGGSPAEIIARQMFAPAPPLRRPADAEPVPPLLERLRVELLSKSPSDRPATAAVVRDRLDQALDPERAHAILPGRSGTARRAERSEPPGPPTDPGAGGAVRVVRTSRAGAVSDDLTTALYAGGFRVDDEAPFAIVLVAADVADARAWLGARSGSEAVLACVAQCAAADLGPLVGAGAADVLIGEPTPDAVVKRLGRLFRRSARR